MRSIRRRNWLLKRIVIGFAVAALVAPAAAEARVDEGSVAQSSKTATIRTIDYPSAAAREAIKARQLDALQVGNLENDILVARNGQRSWPGVDPTSGQTYPQWSSPSEVVAASGFDWDDAGIGAGLTLGFILLGAAAFRLTRHLGEAQTA
jgi:hypothetical protein